MFSVHVAPKSDIDRPKNGPVPARPVNGSVSNSKACLCVKYNEP